MKKDSFETDYLKNDNSGNGTLERASRKWKNQKKGNSEKQAIEKDNSGKEQSGKGHSEKETSEQMNILKRKHLDNDNFGKGTYGNYPPPKK